jgi:hypothetical protein
MKTMITKTTIKKGLLAILFTVVAGIPVLITEKPIFCIGINYFESFLSFLTISIITLIAIVPITFFLIKLRKKRRGTGLLGLIWSILFFFFIGSSIFSFCWTFTTFMNLWLKVLSLIMMAMAMGILTIIIGTTEDEKIENIGGNGTTAAKIL